MVNINQTDYQDIIGWLEFLADQFYDDSESKNEYKQVTELLKRIQ